MSTLQLSNCTFRPLTSLVWLTLFVFFGLGEAGACLSNPESVPLRAGESWRGQMSTGSSPGSTCFVLTVPAAGLLAIELTQPFEASRAYLSLDEDRHYVLRRTASLLLLDASPGSYGFSVRGVGVGRSPFRVQTRFVARADMPSGKDEYDSELEIEPLTAPPPTPSTDLGSITELDSREIAALCENHEAGARDSLLCAERLTWNASMHGDVAAEWTDDARVYRFDVHAVGPVTFRADVSRRSDDLAIELLDRSGQRLDTWTTEYRESERVVVLVPGSYFLRLQSRGGGRVDFQVSLTD